MDNNEKHENHKCEMKFITNKHRNELIFWSFADDCLVGLVDENQNEIKKIKMKMFFSFIHTKWMNE